MSYKRVSVTTSTQSNISW